jgi:protein required for attachment to host cells
MIIKSGTLVLVADGRKFMLLRNVGSATDPALAVLAEEEADNPSTHEQGTDRPGRTHSSMGSRRSSYGDTDWQEQGEELFARHVADALEGAATDEPDAEIVVIAAPQTLGELRGQYGRQTKGQLKCEIAKDLANHASAALASGAIIGAIEAFEPA